jgi:hypothetical protein
MVNVAEHIYHDDPSDGHPDVRTRLPGASYFFLGNGAIQAAVQYAPDGEGTPLGLLVMDPDRFCKKRDSLTMDPVAGLMPTTVRVVFEGRELSARPPQLDVSWLPGAPVPTVEARWRDDDIAVVERFSCPDDGAARLLREIAVTGERQQASDVQVRVGAISADMPLDRYGRGRTWLVYELDRGARQVHVRATATEPSSSASALWAGRSFVAFHEPLLDHLFDAARWQLPAAISSCGRLDGGIWQYNREWVRDQAVIALALTQLGHRSLAATMLTRLLTDFVTPEGATLDSSEVRGRDDVELDQNGILLYALEQYTYWTGDCALVASHWPRVRALADYPLRAEFRHAPSGLLSGSREYWERHAAYGIEPGLELVYQAFVSLGLSSAAALARLLGHQDAEQRWLGASHALREAWLEHPVFRLQDERGFIKRRTLDGRVQEHLVARADAGLPDGVPLKSAAPHWLNPDTCAVLPIVFGMVDATSPVARSTMKTVETLWNQDWSGGGYGRYHVSSEPDSPGPWPFASLFVARAAVEAGDAGTVWRILQWMRQATGGAAGSWFEFYGPRMAPPFPQVGIVPWTWAELVLLFVHHILGVRPGAQGIVLRPHLLPGLRHVEARLPIGTGWLDLTLHADPAAPLASKIIEIPSGTTRLTVPVRTMS